MDAENTDMQPIRAAHGYTWRGMGPTMLVMLVNLGLNAILFGIGAVMAGTAPACPKGSSCLFGTDQALEGSALCLTAVGLFTFISFIALLIAAIRAMGRGFQRSRSGPEDAQEAFLYQQHLDRVARSGRGDTGDT